jgi:peroxiredoxin Q/BCP
VPVAVGHQQKRGYGLWRLGEKKVRGRTVLGMRRMTFLLDAVGRIQRIWCTVKPDGHAAELLAVIQDG